jgi:hypothetical protein
MSGLDLIFSPCSPRFAVAPCELFHRACRVTVAAWADWPHLIRVQPEIGRLIIGIGVLLVIIGLVVWKVPGALTWFGKLPGDLSIQKGGFSFYFPLASCVLISVVLSLLAWVFRR